MLFISLTTITIHMATKRGGNKGLSHWMSSALSKRQSKSSSKPNTSTVSDPQLPWVTQHQPISAVDLAVHKKKVGEVRQWLECALQKSSRRAILLLTGPPGSGKTATLRTLSHELSCDIIEWANHAASDKIELSADLTLYPESQTKQFQTFLNRANRYPSLVMGGADRPTSRKIVLVEEFPNVFLRDPTEFHKLLRSAVGGLVYPLVLVSSDGHHGNCSSKLFTKRFLAELDIHCISFNRVAHTSLVKSLLRVVAAECQSKGGLVKYHTPPREVIEQLAESSAGDIRSAINALQFTCLADSSNLLLGAAGKTDRKSVKLLKKRSGSGNKLKRAQSTDFPSSSCASIGGRDCSLFLFRALGKILHCKRDVEADQTPLPEPLKGCERLPLLVNPEEVLEQCHLGTDLLLLYLHQNYLHFFDSLEHIEEGCGYLSDANMLARYWSDSKELQATLQSYSALVACRGVMYSNQSTGGGKWRPLHKPQWTAVHRQYVDNCETARGLFVHLGNSPSCHLWTPIELQTEILPYLAIINPPLRSSGQAGFLEAITHFKSPQHRPEALGEKDSADPSTWQSTTRDLSSSQPPSQHQPASDSDEVDISDFEDDLIW